MILLKSLFSCHRLTMIHKAGDSERENKAGFAGICRGD